MATTHARALCRSRAASAFRTGWACLMVGTIIRFAECHHKDFLAFPAFAYVTAVMVAGEASLGEALQGAAAAVCGTLQGVGPAMACLWAVGPGKLTVWTSTLAVALSAFVVALPNTTHIIAKRVAFAQMVIVYVVALIQGESMGAIKYPLHVGISTCVGAAASVLALLLPVPKLAYVEVK
ncbi:hypothetical protein AMTR_s00012p00168110 [Amborella trichopoda]|uniref:Uncharacterized protein n=1 Tax=Amborella trichopoda TaxID=13333 RepID=W1PJ96_AMBTC|nr:hypothetical protein AMTR_s00012p00168110 [Amborella trichopoda]